MRPGEGIILTQNNIGGVVSNSKLHDIVPAVRLLEYQRLTFQFSENILLSTTKSVSEFNQVMSWEEENASKRATIDALKNLQAIVTIDLQALQREEPSVSDAFIDANNLLRATVNKHASPLADPLPNTLQIPAYSRKRTPYFAIENSGVPILESPVYVPSPVIESTPQNEANTVPSDSSPVPFQFESDAQVDERIDSGTQRSGSSSDLQSKSDVREASEASDDISESMDSNDTDYVDESSHKAKRKAAVKLKVITETVEPAPSIGSSSVQRSKRVCNSPERFEPDNVKSITEERVFKRVPIDGAPVRASKATLGFLQEYYGTDDGRNWMSVYGKGELNPHGVVYNLRNNPILGTDFFLTVEDARTYCETNRVPRKELPMSCDPRDIHLLINMSEMKAGSNDDDADASISSDDVTEISQFEGYYRSCRCSSKANCHCYIKRK